MHSPPFLCALGALCGCLFALQATNAAPTVLTVDGERFAAELVSVADGQSVFRTLREDGAPGMERTLRLNNLVRWGHVQEPRPQTIVVLADDGRLITASDWSGGAAVRLEGNTVVVLSQTFDEVRLPRVLVRGVVFAQRRHVADREDLEQRVRAEDKASRNAVWLTNGDRLEGMVTELAGGSMTITSQAGVANLPLSRVEAVVFNLRDASIHHDERQFIVGLRDGSLLYSKSLRASEQELTVELADGTMLTGGNAAEIAALQSLGGQFVYLSDLEPADYRHVPYLDIEWPWRRDRSVTAGPMQVRGKRYLKGVGMHSAARLTYRLDGDNRRFEAALAIDDTADGRGSVTFGVYLLRDGQWKPALNSEVVRGNEPPIPVSVDVAGAEALTLTVDYADRGDELDRAVWLDARLVER